MTSRYALLILLLPPLFWAGNAIVGRAAVGAVPPLALSFWRWALAFLLLLPFVWRDLWLARHELRRHWRELVGLSGLGVGAYNSLQYLALTTTSPINVTVIGSALPVFILPLAALVLRERPRALALAGAALSMVGVLVVVSRGDFANLARLTFTPGDLLMLLATILWAGYSIWLRIKANTLKPLVFLAVQVAFGSLWILPFYLWEATATGGFEISARAVGTLAYVAVLPSLVAYYAWDRGVATVGPATAGLYVNLTPVFAALLAVLLLGEPFRAHHGAGLLLVVAGVLLTQWQSRARPGGQQGGAE